jgi:hypothetical protein
MDGGVSSMEKFTPPNPLNTAVLFLVFNRLDTTKKVFEAIKKAKPPRLYVAADGERASKEGEAKKVKAVRDYIMLNIDWDCKVKTLFRKENLGCKYALSGAITWFFENEEKGIILEDDCLPSQSFFWFCEELLEKYKNNDSVYLVSGDSRGPEFINMQEDYGFCKYPMIWGWASWAKVWKTYDAEIQDWPKLKKSLIQSVSTSISTHRFWEGIFEKMYHQQIDTWDYQLCYLLLKNKAKCIVPRLNLISNIGFGSDSTHTFNLNSKASNRKIFEYSFPINHQLNSNSEKLINKFYDENIFLNQGFFVRVVNKLLRILLKK